MGDLDTEFCAAHAPGLRDHARQCSLIVVGIEPKASVRDAAVPLDVGCLDDYQRGAGMRHHAEMHQVPVVGAAIVARVLAHGRHDDAVGEIETGKAKGREQATWA
jgi:hypothetical protein